MKRILVLGGTNFIGKNLVNRLKKIPQLELTLFTRGVTSPNLFLDLNHMYGDRGIATDLAPVLEKSWDYVIDLSGYFPKSVRLLTSRLKNELVKYIYISSCSVYDEMASPRPLKTEYSPILYCQPSEESDPSTATYGRRKAECERAVISSEVPFVILRPALVYGPEDPTDRWYYWLYQMTRSKEILVPSAGERLFSMTYVDDLVDSIVQSLRPDAPSGIYNCISISNASIKKIISTISKITSLNPEQLNASASFLKKNNITEWTDIPLWLDSDNFTYSNQLIRERLDFVATHFERSIRETIRFYDQNAYHYPKVGLGQDKINELIHKLKTK